jgi:hypothetical protein
MTAIRTVFALAWLGVAACGDPRPPRRAVRQHALLGVNNPTLLEQVKRTCPSETPSGDYGLTVLAHGVSCRLGDKVNHYELYYDEDGRITDIRITHVSNAEIQRVFDDMIATLLPDDARKALRGSLADYADAEGVTKFEFAKAHPNTVVSMSRVKLEFGAVTVAWRMRDVGGDE